MPTRAISRRTTTGQVHLTRLKWDIDRIERDDAGVRLAATKEMMV